MTARTVVSAQSSVVTLFAYDYDNRLVKITYSDGSVIEYGYDGIGRRTWRKEDNTVRSFFYDGNRIIAEREGNSWVVRHLLGLMPVGFVSGGSIRIYHTDRLGSVRYGTGSTDSTVSTDNILVSYVYEGFGKVIAQNGGGGGPYQFCGLWGYRNDQDAGLMHFSARYYEPETGRFVQKDPIVGSIHAPQTLNRYVYAVNSPISLLDSKGEQPEDSHRRIGRMLGKIAIGVLICLGGGAAFASGAPVVGIPIMSVGVGIVAEAIYDFANETFRGLPFG